MIAHKQSIGVALGGGGVRGLAHIGVLKVFERERIPIDCLSGSSMGGMIAAAYAAGVPLSDLEAIAQRYSRLRNIVRLLDIGLPRRGLIAGNRYRTFLRDLIQSDLDFADLRLPLALAASDLKTGAEVSLSSGSVLDATLATSAFPGVFPPILRDGRTLIDGGLLNNVPVNLVRSLGATTVIAVDVFPAVEDEVPAMFPAELARLPQFVKDTYQAAMLMMSSMTHARLGHEHPDFLLRPAIPADVGIFISFSRADEMIALGARAAEQALPQLRNLLARQP